MKQDNKQFSLRVHQRLLIITLSAPNCCCGSCSRDLDLKFPLWAKPVAGKVAANLSEKGLLDRSCWLRLSLRQTQTPRARFLIDESRLFWWPIGGCNAVKIQTFGWGPKVQHFVRSCSAMEFRNAWPEGSTNGVPVQMAAEFFDSS